MKSSLMLIMIFIGFGCARVDETTEPSAIFSITSADYNGKKYFFGFGEKDAGGGPLANEPRYDVKHISDVLTKAHGGTYEAKTVLESAGAAKQPLQAAMAEFSGKIQPEDMFFQHSSGHGHPSGLAMGNLSYRDIMEFSLGLKAKEVIVSIMACHSGGLVDAFNNNKDRWKDWAAQGRTLIVMSSSTVRQQSSAGPLNDKLEPNGPIGSAGSAYGHGVWKSMIGFADGYVDGVKDGFVDTAEFVAYTTAVTKKHGGHDTQITGVFNPNTILNAIPQGAPTYKSEADQFSDEELSDFFAREDQECGC